jgi:hypothetical protein
MVGDPAAKAAAEAQFRYRIDVPLPGIGWGRLRKMLEWCRDNISGPSTMHHHSERRPGESPIEYARFYFATAREAEAFRQHWMSD